ncbi:phenylacetate-CoA oxygenase subunit PaaB [Burkholderia pseudomallei MSHR338]|uniref:Phenylacetate-CoA oxygenase, PaaH subunit n=1 Tax=Burkholderia pseudomallei (strain 1106a) TaxID=357348 RepID=A3P0D7_BURP0|nr:phenylacetate-CoA oxygenase, PaaH subunit [Burkholderia pseudomallei 1106a]ACQ96245.1 phenylacetate-CoA oxygenase, PaaH subunit [Burkholderia pseudomallei MSHR346]EBA44477.1 phenylacetate-CoA oxygenase, PaaH subunit [Burkholderia pseudomallei 305]EDO86991.1 phenylacetate-CoA oxygenase, PaaH subunit [Burkholderia pseudomallei 406e]EDS82085.1 phenylacetate-CoA oxygenase, PaaH subunit [Burkholderia pseudomallei S13]EDU09874.1 phenylacetate-CoA oxygenase, PaaH subunit [Burkholderia pseudomallei
MTRGKRGAAIRIQEIQEKAMNNEWPIWEVFVRSKQGLDHKHCGSLHAADASMALRMARDVYTRRQEGVSIWVVPSAAITASDPNEKAEMFEPAGDKIYRHPTFYTLPDEVNHM